jgi:hypothetical protein
MSIQSLEALVLANEVRIRRAQDRRDLQTGTRAEQIRKVAGIIERVPAHMNSLRVLDLLQWPRGIGQKKANVMLQRIGVSPGRRLGQLTDRQRTLLAYELGLMADGVAVIDGRRAA